ncbi:hypothetical protein RA989_21495, partial [Mycobacteroides abscessus subsp. massiliense]
EIFARRVLAAVDRGQVRIAYRHQVDELVVDQGVPAWPTPVSNSGSGVKNSVHHALPGVACMPRS